ncbi:MAG: tyrosine-type recombinase/integrase [Deltaproteobacteria bacterium]|nr:tyrosine-type recombinase/integrase [Deltaproteobacteria bacterium]
MAKRPRSQSKHELRDLSAIEERRCPRKDTVARIYRDLQQKVANATSDAAMLREDRIWIEIRDAIAFLFLLLTALRRFEFCGTTCGDVDLLNAKLWTTGKGNIRNYVPLLDQAVALLRRWFELKKARGESLGADAPLFCATGPQGGFLSFSALRLRWKKLLRELGLPEHYGIHSTRHAAGMIVFAQTGSIEKTARFLRHRDTATTARHYLHVDPDDLREELSSIALWGGGVAGEVTNGLQMAENVAKQKDRT